jgi:hypothetical protein
VEVEERQWRMYYGEVKARTAQVTMMLQYTESGIL